MAYDWTQLTEKEITNLYLYGTPTTPTDLTNDALIRPAGPGETIDVNMASFMATGPGRFALGSQSVLIQTFFSSGTDLSWMQIGQVYSKADVISHLGLSMVSDRIEIKQVELADTASDYLQRSYIWNSGLFKLSDDATFSIDANGNRNIQNYSIRTFNDNFDFVGGGFLADVANAYLQPRIDPWGIGRTVNISFVGSVATRTYTYADYQADVISHAQHVALGALELPSLLFMPLSYFQFFLPNALRSTRYKELNHESDGNKPAGLAETVWNGRSLHAGAGVATLAGRVPLPALRA